MNEQPAIAIDKRIYYQLIALWVLCEAMLGGIIHGLTIPVSGLVVGSCAIGCICLIAWYVPTKGAIIKATIIVAIFKMTLSPQAPPPAYIAVFFQGLMGELLFWNRRFFKLSCILLAVLGLLESGLQRILVLTIVYGNDLWKVINNFINGLTKQKVATNYSLLIGAGYLLLHLITGLIVGWWASVLPKRIAKWSDSNQYAMTLGDTTAIELLVVSKKRKRLKKGIFIIWLLLIVLYVQSYFKIGTPLLPSHISLKILLRSLIIVLGWIFIIGPLLKQVLHRWLKNKQTKSQKEVQEILRLLPATQQLIAQSWKQSAGNKGWKRISNTTKIILVNALHPIFSTQRRRMSDEIYLLTAPIQTGKTTSLINWSEKRNDVHGILTPVINGKRVFMNVYTKEQFPMEAIDDETETLTVGKFVFSKKNFDKAVQIIRNAIEKEGWLIIDEIGPLELNGKGFSEVLKELLAIRQHKTILVVRDKDDMVEKTKKYFNLSKATVITSIPY
jgi:nucleoside-triphosphatase THEP1